MSVFDWNNWTWDGAWEWGPQSPTPTMPLGVIIPSYPYQQYSDDSDIVAFFVAYNQIAQTYLDWFNTTPLAVYTLPSISGPLLDWIGEGIYGISRPVFSSLLSQFIAGVNSFGVNTIAVNTGRQLRSGTATVATDDFYKRVLTWWNYLGNTRRFDIQWLRWRVARFLYGVNGGDITLAQAQTVSILAGLVSPPPAPTLAAVSGGSLPSRKYGLRQTYVTPEGETLAGLTSTLTVAPSHLLEANSPPMANGVLGYNVYAAVLDATPGTFIAGVNAMAVNSFPVNSGNSFATSPMTKQNGSPIAIGTNWTEPASGLIVGAALPMVDTSNTDTNFIITVPAGLASTYFEEALGQGILAFPIQLSASVVIA